MVKTPTWGVIVMFLGAVIGVILLGRELMDRL